MKPWKGLRAAVWLSLILVAIAACADTPRRQAETAQPTSQPAASSTATHSVNSADCSPGPCVADASGITVWVRDVDVDDDDAEVKITWRIENRSARAIEFSGEVALYNTSKQNISRGFQTPRDSNSCHDPQRITVQPRFAQSAPMWLPCFKFEPGQALGYLGFAIQDAAGREVADILVRLKPG